MPSRNKTHSLAFHGSDAQQRVTAANNSLPLSFIHITSKNLNYFLLSCGTNGCSLIKLASAAIFVLVVEPIFTGQDSNCCAHLSYQAVTFCSTFHCVFLPLVCFESMCVTHPSKLFVDVAFRFPSTPFDICQAQHLFPGETRRLWGLYRLI